MARRRRAPSVSLFTVAPQLSTTLDTFQMVARPTDPPVASQVVPQRLLNALLKTKTMKRAVQFPCPKQWQKRICDSLYSVVRKVEPTYTAHRICTKDQVVMWMTPYKKING